jgi:hypothetical protein
VSRALGQTATTKVPHGAPEHTMSPAKRCAKKHAKARHRRVSVPADTTVYTFNVNTMPKGQWRHNYPNV